jgi:bifunctional non-homologous end joining protein LigD
VKPILVCQIAYIGWTDAGHLRHCTFIAMRDDKKPTDVVRHASMIRIGTPSWAAPEFVRD